MPKPLSRVKLEGLRYVLNEAVLAGTFVGPGGVNLAANTTLNHLDSLIAGIKSAAPAESDHMPRSYCMLPGMSRIGCSCGWVPAKAPQRMSTMHNDFMAHRRKLNLNQHNWSGSDILYADGPYKGKTWDEAYDEDKAVKLSTRFAIKPQLA